MHFVFGQILRLCGVSLSFTSRKVGLQVSFLSEQATTITVDLDLVVRQLVTCQMRFPGEALTAFVTWEFRFRLPLI